jgi:hypothetical protein
MVQCRLGSVPQQKFSFTGIFTDHVRWGSGGSKTSKNVENFVGPYDKLSRAAKGGVSKGNCGSSVVVGLQDCFYRIQNRLTQIRLLTPLFLFF